MRDIDSILAEASTTAQALKVLGVIKGRFEFGYDVDKQLHTRFDRQLKVYQQRGLEKDSRRLAELEKRVSTLAVFLKEWPILISRVDLAIDMANRQVYQPAIRIIEEYLATLRGLVKPGLRGAAYRLVVKRMEVALGQLIKELEKYQELHRRRLVTRRMELS